MQVLIIQAREQLYALPIEAVEYIVECPALHSPMPGQQNICGIVNYHGELVPVVDIPVLFQNQPSSEYNENNVLVFLAQKNLKISLLVDKVDTVDQVVLADSSQAKNELLIPVIYSGKVISLINPVKLFEVGVVDVN